MEKFIVRQSEALHGTVRISGAKNAVLPILAACLLTEEPCTITNVPPLTDVLEMAELLKEFGAETSYDGLTETIKICSETLSNQQAAEKNACAMRASFLAAGPLLARCHQAALPLPGGCPIGSRPVDLHLKGFSIMGAVHKLEHGVVELSAKNGLRGKRVYLDFPSVGATENIMMAATLAKGTTTIENAAAEPEICDLADFLRKMGAEITGDGTDTIVIQGQKRLHGATHNVISDRIEAGTFMTAAAITGGDTCHCQIDRMQCQNRSDFVGTAGVPEGQTSSYTAENYALSRFSYGYAGVVHEFGSCHKGHQRYHGNGI